MFFDECEVTQDWINMGNLPHDMYMNILKHGKSVDNLFVVVGKVNKEPSVLTSCAGWLGRAKEEPGDIYLSVQKYVESI